MQPAFLMNPRRCQGVKAQINENKLLFVPGNKRLSIPAVLGEKYKNSIPEI